MTIELFNEYKWVSVIVHVFSVIVGMGSALISDVMFNTFLADFKINKIENKILSLLSNIIWVSLFMILFSGIAIFISNPEQYMNSDKFILKMFIVCVIIINGYLFQRFVHPALLKFRFSDTNLNHKYVKLRKLSFALGAVSFISWMLAFVLGSIDFIPFSFHQSIGFYFGILSFGIVMSQFLEIHISRKALHKK